MHDHDHISRRQRSEAIERAADLINKTFPARRAVTRRRFPEIPVGVAELRNEIVMPSSGPRPEILLTKGILRDRAEAKRGRGFPGPSRRAADRVSSHRQFRLERREGSCAADIRRRARTMDDTPGTADPGVSDQPEIGFGARLVGHALAEFRGEQQQDRGLTKLLGTAEHIAGLATDLPLRQPRHADRTGRRHKGSTQRLAPRQHQ